MDYEGVGEEEVSEPVSPTGQHFNSSALSISILCVLETDIPIDDSHTMFLLRDVFLPINPSFSSIMVKDKDGVQQWKKVEVNLQDHIHVPKFPEGKPLEFYDEYLNNYLSKTAINQLPQSQPLWEIHIIKFPTSNAAGNIVFKLHHALGDGFSLMGALLSCLQRADNPSLPLTFPNFQSNSKADHKQESYFRIVPQVFGGLVNTVCDFGWSLLKSSILQDHRTPIRSGDDGVEFRPIDITTIAFSLDQIKQIKASLEVVYSTALVLLNTRNIGGYKSIKEMVKNQAASTQWGNQFGFLHVSLPKLNGSKSSSPIKPNPNPYPVDFVYEAQKIIKRKRNSSAVLLTGQLLEAVRKFRGPEATAKYIRSTLKNSSMTVSNLIGPLEQMVLANHPIKGLYFMVVNGPQSLTITMMSYMTKLRIAVGAENGLIDPVKFKACIENAFEMIFNDAVKSKSQPKSSS